MNRPNLLWMGIIVLLCACCARGSGPGAETVATNPAKAQPGVAATTTVTPGPPPSRTPTPSACVPRSVKSLSLDGVPRLAGKTLGTGGLWDMAVSADGKMVATAVETGILIYRIDTFERVRAFGEHIDRPIQIAFSPDGATLASAHRDGTLFLWDVATGSEMHHLASSLVDIREMVFSPDGTKLAIGVADGPLYLWEVAPEAQDHLREGPATWPALAFSPAGAALLERLRDQAERSHAPYRVGLSPDGTLLAVSGVSDRTVRVWDVTTREQVHTFKYSRYGNLSSLAFSPDGTMLAGGAVQGEGVLLWKVTTGSRLPGLDTRIAYDSWIAFTPDSAALVVGSSGGSVALWDLAARTPMRSIGGHTGWVCDLAFSTDRATLTSAAGNFYDFRGMWEGFSYGSGDATIVQWDAATGRPVRTLEDASIVAVHADLSPDGSLLAFGTEQGVVRLWDVAAGKPLRTFEAGAGPVHSIAFSPDGATLAVNSRRIGENGAQGVALWDVATGRLVRTLIRDDYFFLRMVFSPDGTMLATPGIVLWMVETGKPRHIRLPSQRRPSASPPLRTDLAFSPDGRLLASTFYPGRVFLVDTRAMVCETEFEIRGVSGVAFSPDGETLALRNSDGVVLVDVASKVPIRLLTSQTSPAGKGAVAFSPDGSRLAVGTHAGPVILWQLGEEGPR